MGAISELAAVLAVLGIIREWDAAEEKRISRQGEAFVPFNLPTLPQQEQPIAVVEADASHALATL